MSKPSRTPVLYYWLPVLVWLGVIFTESMSRYAADDQTSRIIVPVLHWLMPRLGAAELSDLHHLIRKAGHLTGYGLLSYLFFRAFRGTSHFMANTTAKLTRSYRRTAATLIGSDHWRLSWATLAWLTTAMVAAADELHQMTLPYRGGSWWDVLLDSSGAVVFQIAVFIYWRWRTQMRRGVPARMEA